MAPRFSIVTSTFNAGQGLAATARSLQAQTCRDFEWLVMDGASTDDTVAIARSFDDLVTVLVSERDTGIYNAWNKALPHIKGEWVLFLGAGDTLYAPNTLEAVATALARLGPEVTTAYGTVTVVEAGSGIDLKVRNSSWRGLEGPWGGGRPLMPCHQGVFQRACVFREFRFDERCRIAADGELVLRELIGGRGAKLGIMVARFDDMGVSSRPQNRLRMISEFIYINWKIGIFWKRPVYQLAVLALNTAKHCLGSVRRGASRTVA
jgi:glycosyltransferase involved in cell wall biosynthesis